MGDQITITVAAGGDDADARAFGAVLGDILDILDALTKEQLGGGFKAKWRIVGVAKNSPPSMTLECRENVTVSKKLLYGFGDLQRHPTRPFPVRAMRAARRLGRRIKSH